MSEIEITFVFGNCNKVRFSVPRKQSIAHLYSVIRDCLKCDILYMTCAGQVLGRDILQKPLIDLACFLRDKQTISVVYKHPDTDYCDKDLELFNFFQIVDSLNESNNYYNILDGRNLNLNLDLDFNNFNLLEALNLGLDSQLITINEQDYEAYVTKVEYDEINTEEPCFICHESFIQEDDIRSLTCGHVFHNECIRTLLTSSSVQCPVCSMDVRDVMNN